MTLFTRRCIAQTIDVVLIAFILALLPNPIYFPMVINDTCIVILFVTKDLLFRNASIGKKVMKLVVLDENGERPSIVKMCLRNSTNLVVFWFELWLMKKGEQRLGDSLCDTHVEILSSDV